MRKTQFLRRRYAYILARTAQLMGIYGILMMTSCLPAFFWWEDLPEATAFALPALPLVLFGVMARRLLRRRRFEDLSLAEGGIIVLLGWLGAALFGAFPFMLCRTPISFTHAVFECVSGLSTTGLSLVDVTKASHPILLWRATTQLIGGAGLAILMVATLVGPASPTVSAAEGRELLVPNVRRSARLVLILYMSYVAYGIVALFLAGMSLFDAITHTFCAVATGGFSTHPESIAYFNSPLIEMLVISLMLLGATNFMTAWMLLTGNWRAFFKNGELRFMWCVILFNGLTVYFVTTREIYATFWKSIRVAFFETISGMSGTGYTCTVYTDWNDYGFLMLTIAMLMGGGICSTSGALKQLRVYVMFKAIWWDIKRALLPRHTKVVNTIWEAGRYTEVDDARLHSFATYCCIYIVSWFLFTMILTAHGLPMRDCLFEVASAQGGVGLSLGVATPDKPNSVIWTFTVDMFLGRLEFFVVFSSFIKLISDVWRIVVPRERASGAA